LGDVPWIDLDRDKVEGFCEHGFEHSSSINGENLGQL